jgi:hypothetical protein
MIIQATGTGGGTSTGTGTKYIFKYTLYLPLQRMTSVFFPISEAEIAA